MELLKSIIHELIKEPAKDGHPALEAQIEEAEDLLDSRNEDTLRLIDSIQGLYGTKGNASSQGTFNEEGAFAFPIQFGEFIDSDGQDDAFRNVTFLAMENLRNSADGENFATGGYIVFAFYRQNHQEFVLAAMLKKRDGLRLKDLKPESIQEVDLSKLHQAIKINLTRYLIFKEALAAEEPTQGAYLSFISPQKNKSASGYFISAFGCTDALPAAEATKSALEAVRSFFEDDVRLDYLKVNAQDATVALLEDSLKKEEKTCSIDELNNLVNSIIPIEFIDELRDTFVEFANAEPYSVPDRFYTSQSEVTKAKKVKLRGIGGAWSLNFEKRVLGSTNAADIQYRDDHTILIRNLTDAMKNQLEQAILERDT